MNPEPLALSAVLVMALWRIARTDDDLVLFLWGALAGMVIYRLVTGGYA